MVRIICLLGITSIACGAPTPEKKLQGVWKLVAVTCNGVSQALDKAYTLSFKGTEGEYVSKTKTCTQVEPEKYDYLPKEKVAIKSGIRICTPSPCEADLQASECGKEANPKTAIFDVSFKGENKLTLTTSDPNSVDCIGPGRRKPAVFKLERIAAEEKTR